MGNNKCATPMTSIKLAHQPNAQVDLDPHRRSALEPVEVQVVKSDP